MLGKDCDVILSHVTVNGGVGTGFLLFNEKQRRAAVVIERQAFLLDSGWQERVKYRCKLVLADNQVNPDGSQRSETRAGQYAALLALLEARTELVLQTYTGTFTGLDASLPFAEESHYAEELVIALALNNGNFNYTISTPFASYGIWWFDVPEQSGQFLTIGF